VSGVLCKALIVFERLKIHTGWIARSDAPAVQSECVISSQSVRILEGRFRQSRVAST
jgi:hypothetical protein